MTPTQTLIREEILRRLAAGESLRAICRDEGFPAPSTVLDWCAADTDFGERYARARITGYKLLAEEIIEIADDSTGDTTYSDSGPKMDAEFVARSRLRVDTRKWLLAKMLPKVYGDKLAVEASGPDGGPIVMDVKVSIDPVEASQTYQDLLGGQ